ncbi:MAG TPA: hypothetical protein PK178_08025 [Smithellaceae bacterium]|nr:hypothetical protein [Smithellaceae bacterium]
MTILLVVLGLADKVALAAEIGIVQGATLALFYAFSANARSLILNPSSGISAQSVMASRLILLVPLASAAYLLSVVPAGVDWLLAIALILRRCVEWLGEVHLSDMEHSGNERFTRYYLILQVILLAMVLAWFLCGLPYPLVGLFLWALIPLIMSAGYIWKSVLAAPDLLSGISSSILPNLGSTVIIGITVYIFRILILLIVGKDIAGNLFTAFAIGGLTGGVFANALGPSIVLHEQRSGNRDFPLMVRMVLYASLFLGAVVSVVSMLEMPVLGWTGKSSFFWLAAGLSIIGGIIMVYAQRIRLRLLQHDEEHDVFGPDVMSNILLIAAVPFTYWLLGMNAMGGLYLLSSLLAYVFYLSAKKDLTKPLQLVDQKIRMVIAGMLLFPVFFQISNGIFRDPTINYSSGGVLANLPVPISVLACYGGIILLSGYQRAYLSLSTIFFACILMTMATIISTHADPSQQQAKLILLIQFILPMFALILGQLYNRWKMENDGCYEKAFLFVLAIIVPWHLAATFSQGLIYLAPSLGIFSIYQCYQYVPLMLVSAYLLSLFALWPFRGYRILMLILAPLMAIYAVASMSFLAIAMLLAGWLGFTVFQWVSNHEKLPIVVFLLCVLISFSYLYYAKAHSAAVAFKFGGTAGLQKLQLQQQQQTGVQVKQNVQASGIEPDKGQKDVQLLEPEERERQKEQRILSQFRENEKLDKMKIPANTLIRMHYWYNYTVKIVTSPKILFAGSNEIPNRAEYPSAHNYYLDFIYHFGLIAILPILALLIYTCKIIYRQRQRIFLSPRLTGLCCVTLFLLFIDNSLKVGLRQPYSGIFTFFLWGLLLSRLSDLNSTEKFH